MPAICLFSLGTIPCFPLSAFPLRDLTLQMILPRSHCPMALVRFGQWEILAGGWKEGSQNMSHFLSALSGILGERCLSGSLILHGSSHSSSPAATFQRTTLSLWFSSLKGSSCFLFLLIFWPSDILCLYFSQYCPMIHRIVSWITWHGLCILLWLTQNCVLWETQLALRLYATKFTAW